MYLIPVILSGGIGSRLWPLSRQAHPKPFIKLSDQTSLIQKAYLRAANITKASEEITVTNRELFFYTKDEFNTLNTETSLHTFLLEPIGKLYCCNAVAAQYACEKYGLIVSF